MRRARGDDRVAPAPAPEVQPEAAQPAAERPGFPVVGMVASAGGLEAFKKFFPAVPTDSGAAFVLIPHLDPRHESLIAQLLRSYTRMPVREAEEGARVEPDSVYVIPPDKYLEIHGGTLRLRGPVTGTGTSIDIFLRSLADDQQDRAICVVLSGTGSHGAAGLKAIKASGGMAMVQDPRSTQYDGMPRAAIATGLADFILRPEKMPEALLGYIAHVFKGAPGEVEPAPGPNELGQLLALLRARSKFDFRSYRKGMLMRRVKRRIGLVHAGNLGEYLSLLREQPEEVKQLAKDLLISVTSFFRDPEAFRFLETRVIPDLLREKTDDAPLRVWVPGCATGEEAYSIAMLFIEQISAAQKPYIVQVFATDIDQDSLEAARRGVFQDGDLADVGSDRTARFFTRRDEHTLQVTKQLREAVMFAPQNVLADAPFSKIDLVSCRNLLIYLEPEVQQKVVALLHFALNEGGYLMLGPSETVGRHVDLFEPMSKKWRVYRRAALAPRTRLEFPIAPADERRGGAGVQAPAGLPAAATFADLGVRALLESYAPASVLVNRRLEVLQFYGSTGGYLEQPPGAPTQDLVSLARDGLRARIRAAVHKCWREGEPVRATGARIRRNKGYATVHVTARPVKGPRGSETLALVTFEEEHKGSRGRTRAARQLADDSLTHQLEHELKSTREELQSTIEELESANEELKASNEEVMSMNEELQSANEELETSKEELQSLNEELSTVNSQLQEKVDELESTNNDMTNLLKSAEVATLFLGADRTIKRFTPAASALYRVIATDVGRPIGDVVARYQDAELERDIDAVLHELVPREKEVLAEDAHWYLRRITPYRTLDDHIEGVVLSFADVTALKRAEEELRALTEVLEQRVMQRTAELAGETRFVEAILGITSALIVVLDSGGRIVRLNKACEEATGMTAKELLGKSFEELIPPNEREDANLQFERLREGRFPSGYENHWLHRGGSPRLIAWANTCLRDETGAVRHVVATGVDVTEQRRAELELQQHRGEIAHLHRLRAMGELAALLAHELNQPLSAIAGFGEASLGFLNRGEDVERLRRNLEQIVEQAERAGRSIRELRQFLEKDQPEKTAIDLGNVLRAACSLVAGLARARGIHLDCDCDVSLPRVIASPIQVEHVLVNLLQNALDAIRDAGMAEGVISVRARREGDQSLEIEVKDSGPGLDAGKVKEVFEPLYTTKTDGLGLGLSICRSLVEGMGGSIRAEPGPGGKFYFSLPVAP